MYQGRQKDFGLLLTSWDGIPGAGVQEFEVDDYYSYFIKKK